MLESMPRSTANDPNVLDRRMPIDQKIAVRRVLVLANAALHHRRIGQARHALSQILARGLQSTNGKHPLTTIGIELLSMRIDRELEPTPVEIRHCIDQVVEIDPRRHHAAIETVISRRHTKKDYFLPCYMDQPAK